MNGGHKRMQSVHTFNRRTLSDLMTLPVHDGGTQYPDETSEPVLYLYDVTGSLLTKLPANE